jgi:hypothetical protein
VKNNEAPAFAWLRRGKRMTKDEGMTKHDEEPMLVLVIVSEPEVRSRKSFAHAMAPQ